MSPFEIASAALVIWVACSLINIPLYDYVVSDGIVDSERTEFILAGPLSLGGFFIMSAICLLAMGILWVVGRGAGALGFKQVEEFVFG
jgi:hypothetical protein